MEALPVKQSRKRREQLNGFQFWLAGYVIFLFLIGLEQRAKIRRNARWTYYNKEFRLLMPPHVRHFGQSRI